MNERHIVEDRLRKKEQELQGLEEKVRAGRVYVQALRDVLKLLAQEAMPEEAQVVESSLRAGSAVAQARQAILDVDAPVHIGDLLKALGRDASREARASLTSSLAAYVRRGEIFTRPAPNTFGLVELGHSAKPEEPEEPPKGFGRLAPVHPKDLDDDIPF